MRGRGCRFERGFVLAELLVAVFVLAVCSFALWTTLGQMRENRHERAAHMEAMMLAQGAMEQLPAIACIDREEAVPGRWATFRLTVESRPLTDGWLWCQVTVSWPHGRGEERIVQLGKMVPAGLPAAAP